MTDEMVKSLETRVMLPSDEETQINLQSRPQASASDCDSNVPQNAEAE